MPVRSPKGLNQMIQAQHSKPADAQQQHLPEIRSQAPQSNQKSAPSQ